MKRWLLLAVIFAGITSCYKDESADVLYPYFFTSPCKDSDPAAYDAYSGSCLAVRFYDDFSDNSNEWNLVTNDRYAFTISGGALKCSTDVEEDTTWVARQTIEGLSELKNFQIDLIFRIGNFSPNTKSFHSRLLWGANEEGSLERYHSFWFSPENDFEFFEKTETIRNTFFSGDLVSGSFTAGFQHVTIRKVDGAYFFFLNKNLVHSGPAPSLHGDRIHVGGAPGQTLEVDEIAVYAL